MSPIPLHIARRRGPFPLIAYDLAKPLQLWLLNPERPTKTAGKQPAVSSI